jgi:hypothetical protein
MIQISLIPTDKRIIRKIFKAELLTMDDIWVLK